MPFCCIFWCSSCGDDDKDETDGEKPILNLVEPLDLLQDEGTTRQADLWRLCVQSKKDEARIGPSPFYHELCQQLTFQSALQQLTDQYTTNGFVAKIPKIRSILTSLQPFVAVLSAMTQSDPNTPALIWASIRFILSVSVSMPISFLTMFHCKCIADGGDLERHEVHHDL